MTIGLVTWSQERNNDDCENIKILFTDRFAELHRGSTS